jgi:hypothetical protein
MGILDRLKDMFKGESSGEPSTPAQPAEPSEPAESAGGEPSAPPGATGAPGGTEAPRPEPGDTTPGSSS